MLDTKIDLLEKQTKHILNAKDDELVYLALFWVNGMSVNGGNEWREDYYSICKEMDIRNPKEFHLHWNQLCELEILEGDGGSEYITRAGKETIDRNLSNFRLQKTFNIVKNFDRKWKGF